VTTKFIVTRPKLFFSKNHTHTKTLESYRILCYQIVEESQEISSDLLNFSHTINLDAPSRRHTDKFADTSLAMTYALCSLSATC
jgi:hypothetical protein